MAISREEFEDLISLKGDMEKITKISNDGKRLLTRIPKDIVEELGLEKGDRFRWNVKFKTNIIKLEIIKEDGNKKKKDNN